MTIKIMDVEKPTQWAIVTGAFLGSAVKVMKCPKCGFEKVVECSYQQYSVYDPIILVCEDGTEYW